MVVKCQPRPRARARFQLSAPSSSPMPAGICCLMAVVVASVFGCSYGTSQSEMMKHALRGRRDVEEEPVASAPAATPAPAKPQAAAAPRNAADKKSADKTSSDTRPPKPDTPSASVAQTDAPLSPSTASSSTEPFSIPDSNAPEEPVATAATTTQAGGSEAGPTGLTPVSKPEKSLTEIERRQRTVENLTQIGQAFSAYLEKNKQLPMRAIGKPQHPLLSWRVELLPYLGYASLYKQFKLDEAWNSEHNQKLLQYIPPVYQSPDRFDEKTNYLVPVGQGTVFFGGLNTQKIHIEDGLENTICLLEVDDALAVPWTKPTEYRVAQSDPRRGLGQLRKDGFFAVWADGVVSRIREDVPVANIWAAYTIEAGDVVSRDSIAIPAEADLEAGELARAEALREAAEKEGIKASDQASNSDSQQVSEAKLPGRRGSGPSLVPSADAQRKAEALFRQIYRDEYNKAKSKDARQQLAKKLLGEATQLKDDPPGQYVLLRITRRMAAEVGDLPTAITAIGHTVRIFGVDDYAMKVEAVEAAAKCPRPKVGDASERAAIAREAEPLIDRALQADDYEVATKMHALTLERGRRRRENLDKKELTETADRRREIEAARIAFQKVKHVIDALSENPDAPEANLIAGKYYCLLKGQWDRGLPLLERSRDSTLMALAQLERARPAQPDLQVQLADAWWELADQGKEEYSKQMQLRAAYWYLQSLPQLKQDLLRVKADLRVKAAEEEYGREEVEKLRTKLWGGRAMDRES